MWAADGREYRQAARASAEAVIRSVESIVQRDHVCLPPKADIVERDCDVRFVRIGDVVIPSRGEYSATMRRRRHTNNWPEAASVDRPERLDWFREQRDPRTLRSAAPLRLPKHLIRGR